MKYNIQISTYEGNILLFIENTICILEDNYLSYNTDNDSIKINLNNFKFIRENLETILTLTKEKCILFLKELNNSVEIPLNYLEFNNESNKIYIEYKLESQESPLKINIEIGEKINEI